MLPEHFEYEQKEIDKILKTLKKLKNFVAIEKTSTIISSSSGIGTNVMLKVRVKMLDEDFKSTEKDLFFDVTDYKSW